MTAWPQFTRPEGDLDELVELYPDIAAAKESVGSFPEGIFAQWPVAKLEEMKEASAYDKAVGHEARPILAELKQEDGALRYEVLDGPKCFYGCAKCAGLRDDEKEQYGQGAIGVFADSSGGEMERLRKALANMAEVIQKTLAPVVQRVEALEAASKQTAELAEKAGA